MHSNCQQRATFGQNQVKHCRGDRHAYAGTVSSLGRECHMISHPTGGAVVGSAVQPVIGHICNIQAVERSKPYRALQSPCVHDGACSLLYNAKGVMCASIPELQNSLKTAALQNWPIASHDIASLQCVSVAGKHAVQAYERQPLLPWVRIPPQCLQNTVQEQCHTHKDSKPCHDLPPDAQPARLYRPVNLEGPCWDTCTCC